MISSLVELEMHGRPGLPEKQAPGYSLRAAVSPLLIVLSLVLRLGLVQVQDQSVCRLFSMT